MKSPQRKNILVITMGCSKNLVDSEHLMRQFSHYGVNLLPVDIDLSAEDVPYIHCIAINTCGFIQDAKEESIAMILRALQAKNSGKAGKVLVFGCLSQRYLKELKEEIPEVDAFFGAFDTKAILEYLGYSFKGELATSRYQTTPAHYAYLKISEGCNRRCAYCAIPFIRGEHISVPMEDLVEEASSLAAAGVKELIVIAQDTTYYGLDLYGKRMLAPLLRALACIDGIEWIRIHYSYPDSFPDDVIELMAGEPKICKYLDIPLQHGSSSVLRAMKRGIDARQTQKLIDSLRRRIPGVVLRTTLIVGFPGEGNREFNTLLSFVEKNRFERVGAFTYSQEEGTWAAGNLKDSVRPSTKQRRYDALMAVQSAISEAVNAARVGSECRVIVDRVEGEYLICRSQYESPEVDGEILVPAKEFADAQFGHTVVSAKKGDMLPALVGQFMNVKITGADEYDLFAVPLNIN